MLVRNAEGRLSVRGSAGMDDLTVQLVNAWGAAEGAEKLDARECGWGRGVLRWVWVEGRRTLSTKGRL